MFLTSGNSAEVQTGYQIQRSLRFRGSSSAYLSRTPTVNGNSKTFTFSAWVKRGAVGQYVHIFGSGMLSAADDSLSFTVGDTLAITLNNGTNVYACYTNALFRDPSAWYHVMWVVDTTQAVASSRMFLYMNGIKQTFSSSTFPPQNYSFTGISSTRQQLLGRYYQSPGYFFDGYFAEVNFIDGQALTPTSFGEYSTYRHWQPKQYVGTYGTTGFYLPFSNTTSTTTLCADASGNGNNWTPANISLTTGATYDSMYDVPLGSGGSAGNGLGNYPVINPITNTNGYMTVSGGNLSASVGGQDKAVAATQSIPTTGKWYWEYRITTAGLAATAGLVDSSLNSSAGVGFTLSFARTYSKSGLKSPGVTYGASYTSGDLIAVAVDADAGTLTFYKNNVSQGVAFSDITSSGITWYPLIYCNSGSVSINFGQQPFAYAPPTGFKALHTGNLPTPTITNPKLYHNIYTYLGNGAGLQVGETQKALDLVTIDRSLRFRSNATSALTRTFLASGTTTTFSFWVKRGTLGSIGTVFGWTNAVDHSYGVQFDATDHLEFWDYNSAYLARKVTNRVFRDISAWYHIVCVQDTTATTPSDRFSIYVNGKLETSFSTSVDPSLGQVLTTGTSYPYRIGSQGGVTINYFDGYLADTHFVDGQALPPTSFGQFDGNNYWVPKTYSGTYGSNGFRLTFSDPTNITTIAADSSGNGNSWIAQNISLTAGTAYDSMVDTPTNNYATLNPLNGVSLNGTGATLSNSNLTATGGPTASTGTFFTGTQLPLAGKFYAEIAIAAVGTANINFGLLAEVASSTYSNANAILATLYSSVTQCSIAVSGTTVQSNLGFVASNEVYGVAYDADTGTVQFYRNGSAFGTQISGIATVNRTFALYVSRDSIGSVSSAHINFGQRSFAYTPPTGFVALCENNIAEVTSDLESPDLVWIKSRSAAQSHTLFDSVRGVQKYTSSDSTAGDTTDVNSLIQFNKNGFYLGSSAAVNTLNNSYVAWAWKAGTTTVANTAGSITSQVRANPLAGFSIVSYTGNGIDGSAVGHGLGLQPAFVIIKGNGPGGIGGNWRVFHKSLSANTGLYLHASDATDNIVSTGGGGVAANPSSTTFTCVTGAVSNANNVNASTWVYVAYCFAEVAGYSKFGSYTGNGSTNGPFVYCGFRPAFVMIKRTDVADNWYIWDTTRNATNVVGEVLYPNFTNAAGSSSEMDIIATGFKIRSTAAADNASGGTYIYAVFAEAPLKYSLAR